jgi:hypothetical protein
MVSRMDRLDQMDRRARYSVGGAVAFAGVLLLVLGWYLISGQALAAKQLPYLASASLPGAALLVCGFVFMISGSSERDLLAARRIAELHALLTEAVSDEPSVEQSGALAAERTSEPATDTLVTPTPESASGSDG